MKKESDWLYEITPHQSLFSLRLGEVWRYRDLLFLFVKRDIITVYKQTILGPLWFLIQPVITSIVQFFVFGKLAGIPSDGLPYFLFALAGNTLWFYFSTSFSATSGTFRSNQNLFGKVYFPRVIMPISATISNLFKFGIQFLFFVLTIVYFKYKGFEIHPNLHILLLPLLLLAMALISLGLGMIISAMTSKYRDLSFLVSFGVQLFMYVTPVVYPASLILKKLPENLKILVYLNPLTGILETFKYAFLGQGAYSVFGLVYSLIFGLSIFFFGLIVFNRIERKFIDTV
ncbi:MAG: ABC transporter permease [Flavobacteriales bacterium CG_4_9_14_3_um_filter_40_17]|nr:MAG: ABC transporter permease [Flavobacteriales bacterium CG_4_9_14_3_um_filter_40_17]